MSTQAQNDRAVGFGTTGYRETYDDTPIKRQRTSVDLTRRSAYDLEQPFTQRTFNQPRETFGTLPSRDVQTSSRGSYYSQGPASATGSIGTEYNYGHQRTNSSSTSSPFTSPRNEYPAYSFATPTNSLYQQSTRDQTYPYPQSQYSDNQTRQIPQLSQPALPYRVPSSMPSQIDQSRSYSRSYETETQPSTNRTISSFQHNPRLDFYTSQTSSAPYDRPFQPLARTLPDPTQPLTSVLPPLQSTVPSSQPRRDAQQTYTSNGGSNVEGIPHTSSSVTPSQEGQGYLSHMYHGSQHG